MAFTTSVKEGRALLRTAVASYALKCVQLESQLRKWRQMLKEVQKALKSLDNAKDRKVTFRAKSETRKVKK